MKKCPFCSEDVQDDAIKCKHCGEYLDIKHKIPSTVTEYKGFSMMPKIHCPNCGYEGKSSCERKGSTLILIILLICFIVPGIIYAIWRGNLYYVCPKCKNKFINVIK